MKNLLYTIKAFVIILFLFGSCTIEAPEEECDSLVYQGSYLRIDETLFCPASLTVDRIIAYEQGYVEEKIVCNFTTDNGTSCKNDRFINAQISIRTPYPNLENVVLIDGFNGSYAELKDQGIYMDVILVDETSIPVFYEIDIDAFDDELFVEIGLHQSEEFISCKVYGNMLLGDNLKKTSWESTFMFMD